MTPRFLILAYTPSITPLLEYKQDLNSMRYQHEIAWDGITFLWQRDLADEIKIPNLLVLNQWKWRLCWGRGAWPGQVSTYNREILFFSWKIKGPCFLLLNKGYIIRISSWPLRAESSPQTIACKTMRTFS